MRHWTGWVVYNKEDAQRNQEYIQWMLDEAQALGMTLRHVPREEIYVGIRSGHPAIWLANGLASAPDFVIVRTIEPILNAQFEQLGIPTFNSAHVAHICNNKALTHQYLSQFSVPMLDTLFTNTKYLETPGEALYPFPFVLKTVAGRGGKEVALIKNDRQLGAFVHDYPSSDVVVQALGPVTGKDIRVFVVGKRIVAAVLRHSPKDFRANISLGGRPELYPMTEMQEALVRRIISHFDFGLVGIDFLLDSNGGLVFNEIEDVVGSRSLSRVAPNVNIVRTYLEFIHNRLEGVTN